MGVDEAAELARRHLAEALPRRWAHTQAVAAEAARLSRALQLGDEVVAAAWLHDIGYTPAMHDTGFHPLDGARYLRAHGWDHAVCRLVAHHTNASLPADLLGLGESLRAEFPPPSGTDADVLWVADATTGPDGERLTLRERIVEVGQRYGVDSDEAACMRASETLLQAAIDRVEARLPTLRR